MQYILDTSDYKNFKLLCAATAQEEQAFEGAAAANRCLPGDLITLDDSGICIHKRATHPPLVGHLQTLTKTIYGMTSSGTPLFLFTPFNKAYPSMRVGANKMNRTHNYLIVAKFESWAPQDSLPRANLEFVIGHTGDHTAEDMALTFAASPFWRPARINSQVQQPCLDHRIMISQENGWETINIDPAGCRDVDDTFSWRPVGGSTTTYEVAIGISDVDASIPAGSPYDVSSAKNSQTIYKLSGHAIRPMLPVDLSEGRLSLLPSTELKPTVSLIFTFDMLERQIQEPRFALTSTQNNKTYTYETAHKSTAAPLLQLITQAIQTQVPSLAPESATDPHIWIQALMVFYNIKAAPHAAVLRSHSAPKAEKLAQYATLVHDLPELVMEAAKYTHPSRSEHHYGFDSLYCHATSPIRRYSDLLNQRSLKAFLVGAEPSTTTGLTIYALNAQQKAAKAYQRDLFFTQELREGPHVATAFVVAYDATKKKVHLYVSKWKRIIKVASEDPLHLKQAVKVYFVYDSNKAHYKDRLICRVALT